MPKIMNVLTSDFETTFWNKGNPFDQRNKAVALACKQGPNAPHCEFSLEEQYDCGFLLDFDLHVFFNAKFDLHWFRKLNYTLPTKIWCCQVAEFVLGGQKERFPSLEATAVKYGLGNKIDIIEKEYWSKGVNTDKIPQDILSDYACQDVDLTYAVYLKQKEQFDQQPKLYKLFKLMMLDLLVLEEMEWNGLIYDEQLCKHKSVEIDNKIVQIKQKLGSYIQ